MVCAWPEPPFARHAAIIVGVHDGMEALACAITITESSNSLASETEARPSRWIYGSRKAPRTFAMRAPGGQGLGNALVPFYTSSSKKERPLLVAWLRPLLRTAKPAGWARQG